MTPGSDRFAEVFGRQPEARYFSPGRVNLIGEHTDYNGGLVLPIATHLGCTFSVARNPAKEFRVASGAFPDEVVRVPLESLGGLVRRKHWSDYVIGAAVEVLPGANELVGLDLYIESNLPHGGGLSSSAAITVGTATVLTAAWGCGFTKTDIARAGQGAENHFVGMRCGILDPFAVAMGKAGHALLIDCASLAWEPVPFPVDTHAVVVAHTGVRRSLAETAYNDRRRESEAAAAVLAAAGPRRPLAAFSVEDLDLLADDPLLQRRARHVLSENERVRTAASALRSGDMRRFGEQMYASHTSLCSDYAVSSEELDAMVDEAAVLDGIVGAKMTGGGFGGCMVAVVERGAAEEFALALAERYSARTNRTPEIFRCEPGDGAARL